MFNLKIDTKDLQKFLDKISKVADQKAVDKLMTDITNDVTAKLLSRTVDRTPYRTHTLQRSWVGLKGKGSRPSAEDIKKHAQSLPVKTDHRTYKSEIGTNVDYALPVEYGHTKRNGVGWVDGFFMLTLAVEDTESEIAKIAAPHIEKFLNKFL